MGDKTTVLAEDPKKAIQLLCEESGKDISWGVLVYAGECETTNSGFLMSIPRLNGKELEASIWMDTEENARRLYDLLAEHCEAVE